MKLPRTRLHLAALTTAWLLPLAGLLPTALAEPEKSNTDFAQVLPSDDTMVVLVVQDFFKYAGFDEKSPMAKLLDNPAVTMWTHDLLPNHVLDVTTLKDVLGLTPADMHRLFSGKVAFAAMMTDRDSDPKPPKVEVDNKSSPNEVKTTVTVQTGPDVNAVMLLEFLGSNAEFEDLADKLEQEVRKKDPKADIKREREEGAIVRSIESTALPESENGRKETVHCALYNGVVLLSTDRSRLLDTMRGLARGVIANPLSGRSDFISVKQEMGANDGFFLVNFGAIMPRMNKEITKGIEDQIKTNPAAKALIDPKTVVDTLALENFTSFYGSLNITEQHFEARYGLTWKDHVGVAKLINFGPNPVVVPPFATADYKAMTVETFDYPATWDAFDSLVRSASPQGYGLLGLSMATNPDMQKTLTTLRKGILDNLEPELVILTGFPTDTPSDDDIPGRIIVLRVKDPAAAQNALDSVLTMKKDPNGKPMVKVEVKDYLGIKTYRLPEIPMGAFFGVSTTDGGPGEPAQEKTRPVYAFVDNHLLLAVGPDGLIEGVIANMKNPGRPIAGGKLAAEVGDIPGVPCEIVYGDVAAHLMEVMNTYLKTGASSGNGPISKKDILKARDACKNLHYFWTGKSFFNRSGIYGRIVISEDKSE